MSWPNDVTKEWPTPDTEYLLRGYWEINLMCHLLDAYETYLAMYDEPVGAAMAAFSQQVALIPDEELSGDGKERLRATLADLQQRFAEDDLKNIVMSQLYTRDLPEVDLAIPALFSELKMIIQEDTMTNLGMQCDLCLPFLPCLADPSVAPFDPQDMQAHLQGLAPYFNLRSLYMTKKKTVPQAQRDAIKAAKEKGILSSPREEGAKVIDLKNGLTCVDYHCQDIGNADDFCVETEGTCSAMSD